MITASHNPYTYNGIKFIPEYAGPAHSSITKKIENELEKDPKIKEMDFDAAVNKGLIQTYSAEDTYFKHLDKLIDKEAVKKAELSLAVDYLHSAAIGYFDSYLKDTAQIKKIHDSKDPLFSNLNPDPKIKNLGLLQKLVKETNADIGIAFDGDGDRFGIIDGKGHFYSPNQVFTILLPYLLETRGFHGPVYRTVATTHQLNTIAKHYNIPVVETPVGFKYIAEGLLKDNAIFGAEESGGMSIKGHVPEKDGILASLLVVEMLAKTGKNLSQLWRENCKTFGQLYFERIDLPVKSSCKQKIINQIQNFEGTHLGKFPIEKIIDIDGKKFVFNDGSWCLVRPSGTENVIRVYIESPSDKNLQTLKQTALDWLHQQEIQNAVC